jgi:hypothetical protein
VIAVTEINPYSSPLEDCARDPDATVVDEQYVLQQMQLAIRLYWWIGVVGIVLYSAALIGMTISWICYRDPPTSAYMGFLSVGAIPIAIFSSSIYIARRLSRKPQGILKNARLVAIIFATVWFPILTYPGLLCVRRVTKHFAVYCDIMKRKVENTKNT